MAVNQDRLSAHVDPVIRVSSHLLEDERSVISTEEPRDSCDDKVSYSLSIDSRDQQNDFDNGISVHLAAETGRVNLLRRLLRHGDPLITDSSLKTPLHYACGYAYQKRALKLVNVILDSPQAQNTLSDPERKRRLVDCQDENGETALHIAARTEHRLVVEKLLNSSADVNLRDKNNIEPLQLIYGNVPAVMKDIFDNAIKCKTGDQYDENLIAEFDFGVIVGHPGVKDNVDACMFQKETSLLAYCLQQTEKKREEVLLHPIVQVFLFLKWKKIRVLLWLSISLHIIWLFLCSLFITDLYLCQCPYKKPYKEENLCKVGKGTLVSLDILVSFAFLSSVFVAIKKLAEILFTSQLKFYMCHFENIGHWMLIVILGVLCTPLFLNPGIANNEILIQSWQYPVSAFGIVLAWSLILCQIGKIPRFGTYVEMLVEVLSSFIMFMITFSSLFVAFILSFQILMPEKVEFKTFPWGVAKIMAMMIGEFEYEDEFYSKESPGAQPFPTTTKILYAIFMSTVTIILYNLLIGLTISDIQALQKGAQLSSLSTQLEQISMMEKVVVSKKLQKWLIGINKRSWIQYFLVAQNVGIQTDSNSDTCPKINMKVEMRVSELPSDLQSEVRKIAIQYAMPVNDEEEDDVTDHVVLRDNSANITDNLGGQQKSVNDVSHISAIHLREQIKNVLRELIVELKNENPNSKRVF